MKTHQLQVLGAAAIAATISASPTYASELPLGVSSDSTCATYPYVNIGYGEDNPFGSCSGNGDCVQTNVTGSILPEYQCVCDEGWTGRSDWINGDGYDCGVNIQVVQAMWGVNLFVTLVLLFKSIPFIQHRLENTRKAKETMDKKGKKYSRMNNRGLMAVYCFFGFCTPSQIIMCIYRMADTDARVGLDAFPTFLFCVLKFGLYMTSWLFSPALLAAVLRGQKSMTRIVQVNDRFSLALSIVAICLGLLPFVNLAYADENGVQSESVNITTYAFYMLGITVQMVCFAIQALIVRGKVVHELTKSHSMTGRPETLILRQRLSDVQSEITRQAASQLIPYLILFVVPMLWTKHDYALPLTWIAVPVIGFKVAKSADSRMKASGTNTTAGTAGTAGSMSSKLRSKGKRSKKASLSKQESLRQMNKSFNDHTAEMNTNENDDEDECYELKADGHVRSGVTSYKDMDSKALVDNDHGTALTARNPSFALPVFIEDPKPSGL